MCMLVTLGNILSLTVSTADSLVNKWETWASISVTRENNVRHLPENAEASSVSRKAKLVSMTETLANMLDLWVNIVATPECTEDWRRNWAMRGSTKETLASTWGMLGSKMGMLVTMVNTEVKTMNTTERKENTMEKWVCNWEKLVNKKVRLANSSVTSVNNSEKWENTMVMSASSLEKLVNRMERLGNRMERLVSN